MDEVFQALRVPEKIRNVCVIAHVDHGKTSVCDHLVAANGYIPAKLAGKTRFMDSRDDEQQRLITIKSSAIPLLYRAPGEETSYVINLIDSPGHVDFGVEVSAATRLCDGALVVVDVVEGLRSQTKTVLRQAVSEGLRLILMLNKVDRLFTEIKMSPGNAYTHLRDVIENINAYLHTCVVDAYKQHHEAEPPDLDAIYAELAFDPTRGTVLFGSATDGWCCDLFVPARHILRAAGVEAASADRVARMAKCCWGEWSLNSKTQKVSPKAANAETTVATAQFLKPIEQVYRLASAAELSAERLTELVRKIAAFWALEICERELLAWRKKPALLAAGLLGKWSALGECVMAAVVAQLPSPVACHRERMQQIRASEPPPADARQLLERPCVLFVAKSVHVSFEQNRLTSDSLHGRETANDFVGFARVFEGRLRIGDELFAAGGAACPPLRVRRLFVPVGMDLVATNAAGAGAVVCVSFDSAVAAESDRAVDDTVAWLVSLRSGAGAAVTHRETHGFTSVDRCVTLAADPAAAPLINIYDKIPVGAMRFGVSAVQLTAWQPFVRGLALLYRADPAVAIQVNAETGDFVVCCQGQVHYERVLQDFERLYCPGLALRLTPPLIALREALVAPPSDLKLAGASFSVPFPPWEPLPAPEEVERAAARWQWQTAFEASGSGQSAFVKARAMPMSESLLRFLDEEVIGISDLMHARELTPRAQQLAARLGAAALTLESAGAALLARVGRLSGVHAECVAVSLAGDGRGAAFLAYEEDVEPLPAAAAAMAEPPERVEQQFPLEFLATESNLRKSAAAPAPAPRALRAAEAPLDFDMLRQNRQSAALCVKYALDAVTRRGAVCEEPMRGICWVVGLMATAAPEEPLEEASEEFTTTVQVASLGPLIGSARLAFRRSAMVRGCVRVWELFARLEVCCAESALGKVHDLLSSRRGAVSSQTMQETTLEFVLQVEMPAGETFDLALVLRKHASFIPVNTFWRLNAEDPFDECVVPAARDDRDLSAAPLRANVPRRLINAVRERKGLDIGAKLVDCSADKQRTLKR